MVPYKALSKPSRRRSQPPALCAFFKIGTGMPSASKNNRGDKLLGLEILRLVSCLAVLVFHYQHFYFIQNTQMNYAAENQPFYPELKLFYTFGYHGVQIFWSISGFIFFWKYRSAIANRIVGLKKFCVLRFSRLYPLHFATLLLVVALQHVYLARNHGDFVYQENSPGSFVLQLFFASNWRATNAYSFNGPVWSVSVEVLIYIFFFLVLRFVSGSVAVNLVVMSLCYGARAANITLPVVECVSFFYAGGLMSILFRRFEKTRWNRRFILLAAGSLVAAPFLPWRSNLLCYTSPLVLYAPVAVYLCAQDLHFGPVARRIAEAAGNMTYSIYLLHFPTQLIIVLCFAYANRAIPVHSPLFFLAYVLAVPLLAYFVYRDFEKPAQSYLRSRMLPRATT
jgi:peptidoglycan/LPS O-acetylase OafA/YrhL